MSEKRHTPTPWFVTGQPGYEAKNDAWHEGRTIGSEPYGTRVADITRLMMDEQARADSAFIVQAVNAHDDLVAALTEARAYVAVKAAQVNDFDEPLNDVAIEALAKIDAALAKAQPQKE